jgi:predicted TIM-barrel fold metal-dependent hydrolase
LIPLAPTPLIAILRGVKPDEAEAIASVVVEAGFGGIEVPFNSPEPLKSVEIIARRMNLLLEVGVDRIMFSTDHPYRPMAEGRAFLDRLPVSPTDRERIAHGNVERLFGV